MDTRTIYFLIERRIAKIKNYLSTKYTLFKLSILKIKVGKNNRFFGIPYVYLRGKAIIEIGDNNNFRSRVTSNRMGLSHPCMISASTVDAAKPAHIKIGNNCGFSGTTIFCFEKITIGNNVRVGANTTIMDGDAHFDDFRVSPPEPIVIEDNVFIGANCVIKKGVRIGAFSVIGMNSVVTKDIPANCIAVGVPAKFIRQI